MEGRLTDAYSKAVDDYLGVAMPKEQRQRVLEGKRQTRGAFLGDDRLQRGWTRRSVVSRCLSDIPDRVKSPDRSGENNTPFLAQDWGDLLACGKGKHASA